MRNKFVGTGEPDIAPGTRLNLFWRGLLFAVRYEFSVAYKLVLSAILLVLAIIFQQWVNSE